MLRRRKRPVALILPARSHAGIIVVAVAARDRRRAEAYAKRWGIPIVHESYEALIADPSIDCIYNPLPNGLHYAPTLAALKAGKHVLLEKPSVSNAQEARSLFQNPLLRVPNAPLVVEASHYRFHPAWRLFLSQFDSSAIEHAEARAAIAAGAMPADDIRFQYELAGGCAMDLGHYVLSALRGVFGTEPSGVVSATPRLIHAPFDQRCDQAMDATYVFPNGGTGRVAADLGAKGGYPFPWLTANWPSFRDGIPNVRVVLREEKGGSVQDGLTKITNKTVTMWNFMLPHIWHRIDVTTVTALRDASTGKLVKEEKDTRYLKAYTWPEGTAAENKGESWWPTYRYQLEEFVNKIRGNKGSGAWIDGEESINQMAATDMTYEKAGMLLRPSCNELE
ncbi:hypothetical protein ACJQWK_10901 [Exserohilum turcicum]